MVQDGPQCTRQVQKERQESSGRASSSQYDSTPVKEEQAEQRIAEYTSAFLYGEIVPIDPDDEEEEEEAMNPEEPTPPSI